MKKTSTLSALLLTASLSAQVSLELSDLSSTGVSLGMYIVTDAGTAVPPSDGINQTWDFSSVTLQPMGTLDFTAASNTPFAANYPSANWVWAQTVTGVGTDHVYLTIDANGIDVVASDVPSAPNPYTDPKRVLQFPMTYGQSFTDTYTDNDGPASATWTYSGHGTAITPLGTYSDLAKLWSTEDDILLWNSSPLYPLVIDDGTTVLVFAPTNLGLGDLNQGRSVQVYPNPCTDRLVVDGVENATWRITDLQGRTVSAGRFLGTGLQELDAAALTAGSYVLLIDTEGDRRSVRFSKQ